MTSAGAQRLHAIDRLHLLERAGDPHLTALARIAAYVAGARTAALHIFDESHQHRIAAAGAPLGAHPREDSMCRLVVDGDDRIVCDDATRDARFSYSSFVTGDQPVRFYASTPLRASKGATIGTLCTWDTVARTLSDEQVARLEDLAEEIANRLELVSIAVELGHAATHDSLTGALNRVLLGDRLAHAFARQLRRGGRVLVAVVDLDRFKLINDELGHAAGDKALVEVARRLRSAVRAEDTVARLGGDEFAVVAELEPAGITKDEFVDRIESALAPPARYGGELRPLPATVGAAWAAPGDDVRAAIARADQEMYGRKRRGLRESG